MVGMILAIILGMSFSPGKPVEETIFTHRPSIAVKPGSALLLKGVRGRNCTDPAPEWAEIAAQLPPSTTGTFSDGGIGTVLSRRCGKVVPARGIRFTATTKGRERLSVFRDRVAVTVF
ncbi:hypothetical protein ACQKKX_02880 [Neorhizobium sp. NPDC001467]|uniref:hypothetical protein n=1 Tax=Neorhizobium sp. NPDC001467 TaxID=3390595 RepID=UPI003D037E0E